MENLKKNKRIYTSPKLEVVEVDHEISLVMMSPPPNMNDGLVNPTNSPESIQSMNNSTTIAGSSPFPNVSSPFSDSIDY